MNIIKYQDKDKLVEYKIRDLKTVKDIIVAKPPQLSLQRKRNSKAVNLVIEDQFVWINNNLNFDSKLNKAQIQSCIQIVNADYWMLSLEDIRLCFRNGLLGQYGTLFAKIDITDIANWLNTYKSDKQDLFEAMRMSEDANNQVKDNEREGLIRMDELDKQKNRKIQDWKDFKMKEND